MSVTEEVEIKIEETKETVSTATAPLVENVRRLLLAGIGAVALSFDEAETFVKRLEERGEIAQKDGEKLLSEIRERFSKTAAKVQDQVVKTTAAPVEQVENRVESGLEALLARLNIPSKRDIDELSAKIAQLSVRVEELRKTKATKTEAKSAE